MKSKVRGISFVLLFTLLLASVGLPALAVNFPAQQYYEEDTSNTKVFAVQISVGNSRQSVEKQRDQMLEKGYDCFIYKYKNTYKVMCGKFRRQDDALDYQEDIHINTDWEQAYTTNAYLPEDAVRTFEELYAGNEVSIPTGGTGWEDPTGYYYNADAYSGPTITLYTVQFSAGTSFGGAEKYRDDMIEQGFYSFVYKVDKRYRIMSGLFEDRADAEEHCRRIHDETEWDSAYVTTVKLSSASPTAGGGAYGAPTLIDATETSFGVVIRWEGVTGAEQYQVLRKRGNGSWAVIGSTSSTAFLDTTTDANTSYTYTVCCADGGTGSADALVADNADTIAFTRHAPYLLTAPELIKVESTETGIKVTWSQVSGAAKYRVFYKPEGGSWAKAGDTTETSYTWTGAKSGTTYQIRVRCITSDGATGTSDFSESQTIKYSPS